METILVTTLGWLALSVSGSFNHFLKFLNFPSQSSVVSSLLVTFIALFLGRFCNSQREGENSLETRWTRSSLRETRQIQSNLATFQHHQSNNHPPENDVVKGLWTLKKRILFFGTFYFFFLLTVSTIYWLLWHWYLILWSKPVFFLQSSCVPYFLPFILWLARNWHWFDRKYK